MLILERTADDDDGAVRAFVFLGSSFYYSQSFNFLLFSYWHALITLSGFLPFAQNFKLINHNVHVDGFRFILLKRGLGLVENSRHDNGGGIVALSVQCSYLPHSRLGF